MFFWKPSDSRRVRRLEKLHARVYREADFFPGQRPSERVQLCVRTHWLQRTRIFLVFLVVGILLPAVIFYLLREVGLPKNAWLIFKMIVIFYLLLAWLVTFIEFIKSEFTVVVVTNERVVDIIQKSIFDRIIAETNLDRIQEVAGNTSGFWRTFFDIGKLEIQTAGSDLPLLMSFVKSPHLTARKILDIQRVSYQRRRTGDFGKRSGDQPQARAGEDFSTDELQKMRDQSPPARKPDSSL